MGIFDKLLGSGKEYPPLESGSAAGQKLKSVQPLLEDFSRKVKEPLEVVPADGKTYVFVGRPPKVFGLVWIDGGKVVNFKTVAEQQKLSAVDFQRISDLMRAAYIRGERVERYSALIADRKVTVIPSDELAKEMDQALSALS